MSEAEGLERGRRLLEQAGRVAILTGAGVSAESGVPVFRGEDGLWNDYRPEELANPAAFRRDPRLVWEWYAWRRETVRECEPNAAHRAIARFVLEREAARLVTQNVDDLHVRAALEATDPDRPPEEASREDVPERALPLELHGSLFRVRCTGCGRRTPHRGAIDASSDSTLPRCDACGRLLRPDVVWFGESLDPRVLEAAARWSEAADVCLVVGTSAVVEPAASLPRRTASSGGRVLEVNPEETPLSSGADVSLRGPAGRLVPRLLEG